MVEVALCALLHTAHEQLGELQVESYRVDINRTAVINATGR